MTSLELYFLDDWQDEAELDTSAWGVGELVDELGDERPSDCGYGVPLGDEVAVDVPISAWNLTPTSLRRVAAAAAFVPLLSIAAPVRAEPPSGAIEETVASPSEPPAGDASLMWEALVGRSVELTLADGQRLRGTVLSLTDEGLVCARELDGLMVVIDTARISAVHVDPPAGGAGPQPRTGQGMITMGAIATAIGGVVAIATAAMTVACHEGYRDGYLCPYYTIPVGAVSLVSLAVGIPVLTAGLVKRKRSRGKTRDDARPVVSGFVAPGRTGVMGGVGVRF